MVKAQKGLPRAKIVQTTGGNVLVRIKRQIEKRAQIPKPANQSEEKSCGRSAKVQRFGARKEAFKQTAKDRSEKYH